jgi:MFS family permease
MLLKKYITPHFNRTIAYLTASDALLWAAYSAHLALVAIYLEHKLGENAIEIIAFGHTVYLLARAVLQPPIAAFLDNKKGFKDEIWAIFIGNSLIAISFLFYPLISKAIHLYILQFLIGAGLATNLPAWRKTFADSLDKGAEGSEYAWYDTIVQIVSAITIALIGKIIGITDNFDYLFYITGIITFLSSFLAIRIKETPGEVRDS